MTKEKKLSPEFVELLDKVEEVTKESIIKLYEKLEDIRGKHSVSSLIQYSFYNYTLMHIKTISSLLKIPEIQVYALADM